MLVSNSLISKWIVFGFEQSSGFRLDVQGIALHDQYRESNQVEGTEVSLDTLDQIPNETVRLAGWAESTTSNVVDLYLL